MFGDTVDGGNPANQLRLVVYPITTGSIDPSWVAEPSTVSI